MFETAILTHPRDSRRALTFATSLTMQMAVIGAAVSIPLFLIEGPSVARLTLLSLMAPPPPPPPPAPERAVQATRTPQRQFDGRTVMAPAKIPTEIADIVDTEAPQIGVPGGVQDGPSTVRPDGVIGGLLTQLAPPPTAPAPKVAKQPDPPPAPSAPVRRGGDVMSAMLIKKVIPIYPPLAKQARIAGTVKLMGIINREGRIVSLQLISGHPLLVKAAQEAVSQWVYKPTTLNGVVVEVVAPIDVHFTLTQ